MWSKCKYFCSSFPPKKIPSFTWLGEKSKCQLIKLKCYEDNDEAAQYAADKEYAKMMRHIFILEHSTSS